MILFTFSHFILIQLNLLKFQEIELVDNGMKNDRKLVTKWDKGEMIKIAIFLANWNILSISDLAKKKLTGLPIFICHNCEIEKQFGISH